MSLMKSCCREEAIAVPPCRSQNFLEIKKMVPTCPYNIYNNPLKDIKSRKLRLYEA